MKENNFNNKADKFIENLSHIIEKNYPEVEVEILEKILYINHKNSTYVINKHNPTQQIWISSPVTGAHHFIEKDNLWVNNRDHKIELIKLLQEELQ